MSPQDKATAAAFIFIGIPALLFAGMSLGLLLIWGM